MKHQFIEKHKKRKFCFSCSKLSPSETTLNFIRNFAKDYRPDTENRLSR